jgi:hypothetical protein
MQHGRDLTLNFGEKDMGILNLAEEAAGAFAADKALEAVDPDAGFLAKAAAAVAGFEGVSKLQDVMSGSGDDQADAAPAADDADSQT